MGDQIPKRFWEDNEWRMQNADKLREIYKGEWVAIVGKEVVAHGDSPVEVREKAERKTGFNHLSVDFVESGAHIY